LRKSILAALAYMASEKEKLIPTNYISTKSRRDMKDRKVRERKKRLKKHRKLMKRRGKK